MIHEKVSKYIYILLVLNSLKNRQLFYNILFVLSYNETISNRYFLQFLDVHLRAMD